MKYTKDILDPIVKESKSISEVLRKLGLKQSGGSHSHLSKVIKKEEIDISHFVSSHNWNKGKKFGFSYPLEDYLSNRRYIASNVLRRRLVKEEVKTNNCERCGLSEWLGVELSLELHHIDSNHSNNNLANLQILCPNCHCIFHNENRRHKTKSIQTKGIVKNSRKENTKSPKPIKPNIVEGGIRVSYPRPSTRKVERPSYEILVKEIAETSYCSVAKKYGVSDNAIRKWVRIYEKYN